ncbi:DUF7269 family protein [Haloglomus halophilum]|uniref:DUF7269 family protein n=1 Tax=Haloglomus halophilum TaxID=2962672 RepID=UPI0020C98470|nr:hypothetical protein [Haloglomus halophilum]
MSRRALAAVALALAALGLLARSGAVLPPGLGATLASVGRAATPVAAGVLALGTAVGAAALVRGRLGTAAVDPAASFRATRTPGDDYPLLGADVAAALDRVAREGPGVAPDDRATVRAAVEHAGVTVLSRAEGLDEGAARSHFRRGEWTRDPAVAAFCGADVQVPLRRRVDEALAAEPRFVQRARLTVDALATVAEAPSNPVGAGGAGSARHGVDATSGPAGGERA